MVTCFLLLVAVLSVFFPDPAAAMQIETVPVPGGCFVMGCGEWARDCGDDEKPPHRVCLQAFRIGRHEVTQNQWREIMGTDPSSFPGCDPCPVDGISWDDARTFVEKLNRQTGRRFRLPTEAEWEYAARDRGGTMDWAGADLAASLGDVAWYQDNSGMTTKPVGTKRPNGLGLHDMSGNLWEWCADVYDGKYYGTSPEQNPPGPATGPERVIRGGSWAGNPASVRTTERFGRPTGFRDFDIGFRLAEDP